MTKDIIGYEGIYTINTNGVVIKLEQSEGNYKGKSYLKEHVLKQEIVKRKHTSYARVTLCKDGTVTRFSVHRLVAMHFIPNPESKPQVNHLDNNGLNNSVNNLEWCTNSENMKHASIQDRLPGKLNLEIKAKERSDATDTKVKSLLGQSFINIYSVQSGSRLRKYVQYYCKSCNQVADARIDNPRISKCTCVRCM